MRKMKRLLATALCCVCLLGITSQTVSAANPDDGIMPCWDQTNMVSINLTFSNNKANCTLTVQAYSGLDMITGYLQLYDDTTGERLRSWAVKGENSYYHKNETWPVTRGHQYTLIYKGTVTGSQGTDEITVSKTATYN